MSMLQHLELDHNRMKSLQDVRLLALNLNLKSITLNDNPLCEEASYLKLVTSMLPQVESLNNASVVSAQLCPIDVGNMQYVSDSPSTTSGTKRPVLSPFINPLTPSPRLKPTSPFLKPAVQQHGGRIPDVDRDDELWPNALGVSLTASAGSRFGNDDGAAVSLSTLSSCSPGRTDRKPAEMTLKLALDFNAAGKAGSAQRAAFNNNLIQDLSHASGLAPHLFEIVRVSAGSIIVDTLIHADPADRGLHPMLVATDLQKQAHQPNSPLLSGLLTRHCEGISRIRIRGDSEAVSEAPLILPLEAPLGYTPPSIEDFDSVAGLPEHEASRDFWEQSTNNAHINSILSGHSKALSSRAGRPSAMQMLAVVAMTEVALADPVSAAHTSVLQDASHRRTTSLTGTGRVGSVVTPKVVHTPRTPRKTEADEDSGTLLYNPNRISPLRSRLLSHDGTSPQAENSPSRSSRVSPPESRPMDVKRVAESEISPSMDSKRRSPESAKTVSPPITTTGHTLNARQGRASSLSPPGRRTQAPSIRKQKRCASQTSPTFDVAEMLVEIEQALKITCLVFQAWKVVLAYGRLARHLDGKDSRLVLVSRTQHNVMLLRPVFEAWIHVQDSRHRSYAAARVSFARQALLEWSALAHFQKLFGARMRRRLQNTGRTFLKSWRLIAVESLRKKAAVYRRWRRQDTTLVGAAFASFVEQRERACTLEAYVVARLTQLQVDVVNAVFMAWMRASTKKMAVSNLVSNACRKFFAVGLKAHCQAWHKHALNRARISRTCSNLGSNARRKIARRIFSRLERHRIQQVYRKRVVDKVERRVERLRKAGLLGAWRHVVFGNEVHSRLLKFCTRRKTTVIQSSFLRVWINFIAVQKQLTNIEEGCDAIGKKRDRRQKMLALSTWLHWQMEKHEHSLVVLRALHKRHRCLAKQFWDRLRGKVLKTKIQSTIDTVMVRKVTHRFMRVLLEQWNRNTRQSDVLRRRLPVILARRLECDVRGVLYGWHEVAHRRFQVAAMLDKILLRRKQQHSVSPEVHSGSRRSTPRLNLARHLPHSPRQTTTSPRQPDSGN
jgi:hypothetical protein